MQNSLFKQYQGSFDLESEGEPKKEKEKVFKNRANTFALADAFGAKSPKDTWVNFIKLREEGIEVESLHAALVGKIRDMLSTQYATAEDLELHPFVYKKAKADFKNWSKEKLEEVYEKLVLAYHESRLGGEDLSLATEKILLAL